MSILNLTQHNATPEQIAAGVVELPPDVAATLRHLLTFEELPESGELQQRAREVMRLAVRNRADCSTVMIGGAPFFMAPLEAEMRHAGFRVVYAFSRRESVEQVQPDGSVRKVAVFRHAGFVAGEIFSD